MPVEITTSPYGTLPDRRKVHQFVLTNSHGVRVALLDYGATLASVAFPDRDGKVVDVTHGYDDLAGWLGNKSYFGANVGRFANRIAGGKFSLDGKTYTLAANNAPAGIPCHLHGGDSGFDKKLWKGKPVKKDAAAGVEFHYISPDGEEGYPGALSVKITCWLTEQSVLRIEFHATTDQATIVNLTNHVYWNLTGDPEKQITGHEIRLEADEVLQVDKGLIPTGATQPVEGTPFDFTRSEQIGRRIEADNALLKAGNGYDHCWVLRGQSGLRIAAHVHEPSTGRTLELFTDQPGLQLYSGNFLDGTAKGKSGVPYQFRTAFCLEPQRFPDTPNHASFPSAVLRPGEVYSHVMEYRLSAR
ncbi:MAG TPA: aldose epimerase family protein [Lacunisphaera sp.]